MYNLGVSPVLINVTFSNNSADVGGAMYNDAFEGYSSPILVDVTFSSNSAGSGGAMVNMGYMGNSGPTLRNVIFTGNSTEFNSGAMTNWGRDGNSVPELTNVSFSGNSAGTDGGAMYNGGMFGGNCTPILTNTTFSGNYAGELGGAIYNSGLNSTATPELYNSILWNNQDISGTGSISTTIYNESAAVTLTYSLVQGAGVSVSSWIGGSYQDGGDNIDGDPLFITPINPPTNTLAGNLRLKAGSPAADAGNNTFVTLIPTDLDGGLRVKDGDGDGTSTVDMGAYEAKGYFYLNLSILGTGSGKVTSSPASIECLDTCMILLKEDSTITLIAIPEEGSIFLGWSGDYIGTGNCELTMDAVKSVTAHFEPGIANYLPLVKR